MLGICVAAKVVWLLFLNGIWSNYGTMVCAKSQSVQITVDEGLVSEHEWVGDLLEQSRDCERYTTSAGMVGWAFRLGLDIYLATVLKRYVDEIDADSNFKRVELIDD